MTKYKVGDVVLLKSIIEEVNDPVVDNIPYRCRRNLSWFGDADVVAVVVPDEPEQVVETKPEPLKVGDFVWVHGGGETRQVVRLGNDMFTLLKGDGNTSPHFKADFVKTDKPADWPF